MTNKKIVLSALTHALLTTLYVAGVASLMSYGETVFGNMPKNMFAPAGFLLLFVTSAAITGSLVFGKPLLWCLDGKKREGVRLALYIIAFLAVIVVALFASLAVRYAGAA